KEALSSEDLEVKHLKNTKTAAYFKVDQEMKRFHQMTKMMNPAGFQAPLKKTLVINPNHPLIQTSLKFWEKDQSKDLAKKICNHVQDLANLSSEGLSTDT